MRALEVSQKGEENKLLATMMKLFILLLAFTGAYAEDENKSLRRRLTEGAYGVQAAEEQNSEEKRTAASAYDQVAQAAQSYVRTGSNSRSLSTLGYGSASGSGNRQLMLGFGNKKKEQKPEEEERPVIYSYAEQSSQYDPNDDTNDLIENWRKAWYDVSTLHFPLNNSEYRLTNANVIGRLGPTYSERTRCLSFTRISRNLGLSR